MAGPGGGSRGGGFGGGSFGGGGNRGGFGGPGHRGPHHHHHHGFYYHHYGFYRPYGFFGIGGGFVSILLMPFLFLGIATMIVIFSIFGMFGNIAQGGVTDYDEARFQEYADYEYRNAFGASTSAAYEDNILIVFLTNEEANDYYCIAWVGDHVDADINRLFGNQYTEFGTAIYENINVTNYKYSLDSNLALVVDQMADEISDLDVDKTFSCKESEHNVAKSKLINRGVYNLNSETVNAALERFTEETGITMSIVVNNMDTVLGVDYSSMIMSIIIVLILVALSIFFIVKGVQARRRKKADAANANYDNPFKRT